MSLTKNTRYRYHPLASDYHRILGSKCYSTDLDMIEFTYSNNQPTPVALFDYKYPGEYISDQFPAIQCQLQIANSLQIAYYLCIYYLDESKYPIPMYYLIPANNYTSLSGSQWMTLLQFSKFLHQIRKLDWSPNEIISSNQFPQFKTLKELPNEYTEYQLPKIQISSIPGIRS